MSIAPFLKDIGRGAAGARSLSQDDARTLMDRVLAGEASPAQTGAFLIAMRMKGETLPELTGFLASAQAHCMPIRSDAPVVVMPSYNGSRRLPNLTPLLALWLAREGVQVLLHGPLADASRVGTAAILENLGVPPALHPGEVADRWARREPAFVPLRLLCPPLQALLDLRQQLGVRGPGHTVAKMLDPVSGGPSLRLVNHTHPEFGALMAAWARESRVDAMLLRGTEGEPVADPRRLPRIETLLAGEPQPELSAVAQEGVLAELPWLPRETDAASTAVYVQEVLSGMRPAPAPVATQAALVLATVAALGARRRPTDAQPPAVPSRRAPSRPAAALGG